MKNYTFVIAASIAALLSTSKLNAQTDWKLSGNTVTTDSHLGTNNGYDLIIETGNYERMRITDGGFVGIGIANPEAALHLQGEFKINGNIRLGNWLDGAAEEVRLVYTDPNGVLKTLGASSSDYILGEAYKSDCNIRPGQTVPTPAWQAVAAPDVGYLFTGTGCATRVGIGVDIPENPLHVQGSIYSSKLFIGNNEVGNGNSRMRIFGLASQNLYKSIFDISNDGAALFSFIGQQGSPFTIRNSFTEHDLLIMHETGSIDFHVFSPDAAGIVFAIRNGNLLGQPNADIANLTADGKWWCQGVIVKHVPFWGDFVFDKEYELKPLALVEQYINENHHLPDMPSAEEVAQNGFALEEMLRLLTIKVEELTLHAIAQEKEIERLKEHVVELENK